MPFFLKGIFILKKIVFSATIGMLLLNKGQTTERIVVTLTEKVTIPDPFYAFVFTHITTKEKILFYPAVDLSLSPERYNAFNIDMALFANAPTGQWLYEVFESPVAETNPVGAGLNMLENGKMLLQKADEIIITGHNPSVTYTGYAGQ